MATVEERLVSNENKLNFLTERIKDLEDKQEMILNELTENKVDREKYRLLVDTLIQEKYERHEEHKKRMERNEAIKQKLVTAGLLSGLGIIITLFWEGFVSYLSKLTGN